MHVTVDLDDDVTAAARRLASSRRISIGAAVSELARQGLSRSHGSRSINGFIVFDLPEDSPRVSSEDVKRLQDLVE
jgi:hypothetical protein